MLVIDDADGPTSIAGVMGGERSEVHEGTTRVLMEAANWDGPNIHRTSQLLGLRSEASGRFEKGLAPEQALQAEIVATRLMLELTGARLVPGTIDVGGDGPPAAVIRLREHRVQEILGLPDRAPAPGRDPARAGVRRRGGAGRPRGPGARLPAQRRHARGRPHRGGRAHGRPREAARHAAQAPRQRRAPEHRAAPAPARRSTRSSAAACTRSSAGASPSPGWPTACAWRPTIRAGASSRCRTR